MENSEVCGGCRGGIHYLIHMEMEAAEGRFTSRLLLSVNSVGEKVTK